MKRSAPYGAVAAVIATALSAAGAGLHEATTHTGENRPAGLVFLSRHRPAQTRQKTTSPGCVQESVAEWEMTLQTEGRPLDLRRVAASTSVAGMGLRIVSVDAKVGEQGPTPTEAIEIMFDTTGSMPSGGGDNGEPIQYSAGRRLIQSLPKNASVMFGDFEPNLAPFHARRRLAIFSDQVSGTIDAPNFVTPAQAQVDLDRVKASNREEQTAFASLLDSIDRLAERPEKDRSLIMMSDFCECDETLLKEYQDYAIAAAKKAGVRIYVIVFSPDNSTQQQTAAAIANGTNGKAVTAENAADLNAAFASIGKAIVPHYTNVIHYRGSTCRPMASGAPIPVQVKVDGRVALNYVEHWR